MAHLDSLIFGLSFVTVGSGFEGEPDPLITRFWATNQYRPSHRNGT